MSVGECGSVKRGYNHEHCQRVLGVLGDIVNVGVWPYLPLLTAGVCTGGAQISIANSMDKKYQANQFVLGLKGIGK